MATRFNAECTIEETLEPTVNTYPQRFLLFKGDFNDENK